MPTISTLLPELSGRNLTVDTALKQPSILRARIAELADSQLLAPQFYHPLGGPVQGGAILYNILKASDLYTTDVEKRAPGAEYKVVEGVDPETQMATVNDWGGKFQVTAEQIKRNVVSYLDQQTTQLANTLTAKLDAAAMAAVEAAIDSANSLTGHSWEALTFVGPLTDITPSDERPTADFSAAQLKSDLQELGVKHDLLVVHPNQAHRLRTAYGDQLQAMLTSAGLSMFSNPRVTTGAAYVLEKGGVGTIGFEEPLTVQSWEDKATRSWWVQAYAVPAFAVERPYAIKKITGLAA
ncbi:hypothetical protein MMUR_05460 [Mycolicibacterium murale]|uniref:Major capsid protein n=1 Tax=Mycolicibacterium murale TaxID=182220 RepID=A0A7I9WGG6_9MYCO|nr:major capsid protein [Mycolicibacterium murale]MCV7182860.1 hypothetical protein [Mycolicibacterium murale]GFG56410.1 hypothetical protein MMUR_05460 [Mycolicibacterium murale]